MCLDSIHRMLFKHRDLLRYQPRPLLSALKYAMLLLLRPMPLRYRLAREVHRCVVSLKRLRANRTLHPLPTHRPCPRRAKRLRAAAHEPRHAVAVREQRANQRATDETCRACNDDFHQSSSPETRNTLMPRLFSSPRGQCFERDLAVVEVSLLCADDLVVLVPFARDDDEVARARLFDCASDGLATVNDFKVRSARCAQARFNVAQDVFRVFRARVVGRTYDDVAQTRRGLAHRRALRSVAVAAAAEHSYDPTARHAARRPQNVSERVVRVRVVNHNSEAARIRHALEASRRSRASAQSLGGRVQTERERVRARGGGQDVVDVRATDERRRDIALALRRDEPKPCALHRALYVARRDLSALV